MSSTDVSINMDTMHTDDLDLGRGPRHVMDAYQVSRRPLSDSVEGLRKDNDRLSAENYYLRKQIYMVQENSSLRVANILAKILSWFDNKEESGE